MVRDSDRRPPPGSSPEPARSSQNSASGAPKSSTGRSTAPSARPHTGKRESGHWQAVRVTGPLGQLLRGWTLWTLFEPALIGVLLLLLQLDETLTPWDAVVALSCYAAASLLWLSWSAVRLRATFPTSDSKPHRQTTTPLSRDFLPTLAALIRPVIWILVSNAVWLASWLNGTDIRQGGLLLSIVWTTAFISGAACWLWTDQAVDETNADSRPTNPSLAVPRIQWSAIVSSAVGVAVVTIFDTRFIEALGPKTTDLATYLPATLVLLSGVWIVLVRRLTRVLRQPNRSDETVFRTTQALPYVLVIVHLALWTAGTIVVSLQAVLLFGLDAETAWLILATSLVVGPAVVLYTGLWHRRILRPVLEVMSQDIWNRLPSLASPLSLRTRMLVGFGGLILFAGSTAFFWGYVQYRNLATAFVQKEAQLKAELLLEQVRSLERLGHPVTDSDVTGLLRKMSMGTDSVCHYLSASGEILSFSGRDGKPPHLPFQARTRMRQETSGTLRIPEQNLAGAFLKVALPSGNRGAVAVLYPDYRGRGPGMAHQIKMLLIFFLAVLFIAGGIVYLMVDDITGPLQNIEARAEQMARGDLQAPIRPGIEVDELGRLAASFERMRQNLDQKLNTIQELNVGLEGKVSERTADLALANQHLQEALDTLTATKDQLVRSEKLASIGELVAGVSHELNNPINAVVNCIHPLRQAVDELVASGPNDGKNQLTETAQDISQILEVIRHGTDRAKRIVAALSSFSRADTEPAVQTDINAVLDDALSIVSHLLAPTTIHRDYGKAVEIMTRQGQIEQVFVNLLANAAQAVEQQDTAKITITTRFQDGAAVTIEDNGPGIPEDVLPKIFDPFFTTKEVGKGTGLGLSISQDIVARHGGTITVESQPGQGTKFEIKIPATQPTASRGQDG